MNEKPLISVILAVKDGKSTVKDAVLSVLGQDFGDFELIAVDDGSTDGTGRILDELAAADRRIRVVHKENEGVSAARNTALLAARGAYAAFIDSDDTARKEWLRSLLTGITTGKAEISVCGYETVSGGAVKKVTDFKEGAVTPEELMAGALRYRQYTNAVWNKMFLLDIIREHQLHFHTEYVIGEDLVFFAEYLGFVKRAYIVGNPGYIYHENPEGAMGSFGRGTGFRSSWITEWNAVRKTEEILKSRGTVLHETKVKKVRVAGKLLPLIRAYGYDDRELEKELLSLIRSNPGIVLLEKEFEVKRRILMAATALSPGFGAQVRKLQWKIRGQGL